ncbi:hypothetical protein GCM10029963_26940 [Micromonospora andamanensis]
MTVAPCAETGLVSAVVSSNRATAATASSQAARGDLSTFDMELPKGIVSSRKRPDARELPLPWSISVAPVVLAPREACHEASAYVNARSVLRSGAAPEGVWRGPARGQVVAVQVTVGVLVLLPEARKPKLVLAPAPRLPL